MTKDSFDRSGPESYLLNFRKMCIQINSSKLLSNVETFSEITFFIYLQFSRCFFVVSLIFSQILDEILLDEKISTLGGFSPTNSYLDYQRIYRTQFFYILMRGIVMYSPLFTIDYSSKRRHTRRE